MQEPCARTALQLLVKDFAVLSSARLSTLGPTFIPQRVGRGFISNSLQHRKFSLLNQRLAEKEPAHQTLTSQGDGSLSKEKEKQVRTPWHREGSSVPPVSRPRTASATTKGEHTHGTAEHDTNIILGKLLTTPSRLLKLILPLTTLDKNSDRKDVEPLALLVHPQQPLSYLERLIQSELPTIKTKDGKDKIPAVHFRAEDSAQDKMDAKGREEDEDEGMEREDGEGLDEIKFDGKIEKTGNVTKKQKVSEDLRGGPGEGGVESYSGAGREKSSDESHERKFVRWSTSTEIGDFIRDAARGKEFAVEIEGSPDEIRVGVPSFNDRTHYLRTRLRKTAGKIMTMAAIKKECDETAHRSAQRVALGGFGILAGWWYTVYRLTFETDLGWDTMEPVTYLVGLSTLIGGYGWFLYHNREVSYRSALNITISARQKKLYAAKGFDLHRWDALIEEGNSMRKEIKAIANEYDVDWDETADEKDKTVTRALKKDRDEKKQKNGDKKDEGDDDDD